MTERDEAIQKVKNLLAKQRNATMATVNEDGTPHNTPFFFLYDNSFKHIYIGSHPESVHSKNIVRTGQAFIVLYDSSQPKMGGLYIRAVDGRVLKGEELAKALEVHNAFRSKVDKPSLELTYYSDSGPQRLYSVEPVQAWILMSEDDDQGLRIKDYREEISIVELTSLASDA